MTREELCKAEKLLLELNEYLCRERGYINAKPNGFDISGMRLLYFRACLDPECYAYGTATGTFVYGDEIYRFSYNVHTPVSKGPGRSNQMNSLELVRLKEDDMVGSYITAEETDFGQKAFWLHTPISALNEEEKAIRMLMKALQVYVREQGWMKRLRRLDDVHEKWERNET